MAAGSPAALDGTINSAVSGSSPCVSVAIVGRGSELQLSSYSRGGGKFLTKINRKRDFTMTLDE
jgi:hypothetical protein